MSEPTTAAGQRSGQVGEVDFSGLQKSITETCRLVDDLRKQNKLLSTAALLYLATYADTQTHPTPAQEAMVISAMRFALKP